MFSEQSMFKYDPITEDEAIVIRFNLLPKGTYKFRVEGSTAKVSKKNNPMIELQLVIDHEGKESTIRDWLIGMDNGFCKQKIRKFCESVGLLEQYEAGTFNENSCMTESANHTGLHHKRGYAQIDIEKGKQKDDGDFFPDKNVIAFYIPQKDVIKFNMEKSPEVPTYDDSVPF